MADYLPPRELWPNRIYTLPEFAAYPDRFNPAEELLEKHVAAGRGDRVAILSEDQRITYAQLLAQANKFGNALHELGIREGDRVLLRTPTIPPAIVANFAVLKLGAVIARFPRFSPAPRLLTWPTTPRLLRSSSMQRFWRKSRRRARISKPSDTSLLSAASCPNSSARATRSTASCCKPVGRRSHRCAGRATTWPFCCTPPARRAGPRAQLTCSKRR